MLSQKLLMLVSWLGLLMLVGCAAPPAATTAAPSPSPSLAPVGTKTLVIGEVSDDPAKKIKRFQPLADYLAANLGAHGVGSGEVKIAPDLATMARMLEVGEVDLYFDSPYPAMVVNELSGATPILRRWKGGAADYFTVFFTRSDSGITTLADLQGRMLAFEDTYSTSGYFLPMTHLLAAGMQPAEKPDENQAVQLNEIGYVWSGDEENTVQWVLSGKVVAGAVDHQTFAAVPPETRTALTVLAETARMPRHMVLARPNSDAALVEAIKTVLTGMDKTPDGQAVLEQFEETARFDALPPEVTLEAMRPLYRQVTTR